MPIRVLDYRGIGVGDGQWVFFGGDSVLAMIITMATGGGAPASAGPLAEVMDAKIRDAMLQ
jgi:hypothetical protein